MLSQKPPEAVSDVVNFKIILGEHAPRPPSLSMLPLVTISFADEKSCVKPCSVMVLCKPYRTTRKLMCNSCNYIICSMSMHVPDQQFCNLLHTKKAKKLC